MRFINFLFCLFSVYSTSVLADDSSNDPTTIDIPNAYNGIRCKTQDGTANLYMDVYHGNLGSLYWIANDRVTVLSTQLTVVGRRLVSAHDTQTDGSYLFDIDNSDLKTLDSDHNVIREYEDMNCVFCPADQDRCPNSESLVK